MKKLIYTLFAFALAVGFVACDKKEAEEEYEDIIYFDLDEYLFPSEWMYVDKTDSIRLSTSNTHGATLKFMCSRYKKNKKSNTWDFVDWTIGKDCYIKKRKYEKGREQLLFYAFGYYSSNSFSYNEVFFNLSPTKKELTLFGLRHKNDKVTLYSAKNIYQ